MIERIITNLEDYAKTAFPEALEVARSSKHVSIILDKKGTVLSLGTNAYRTHPEAAKCGYQNCEVHSELDAFLRLDRNQKARDDLVLLNFRFNSQGDFRLSRPCVKCMPWCSAIFKEIIYTTKNGYHRISIRKDFEEIIGDPIDNLNMNTIMEPCK